MEFRSDANGYGFRVGFNPTGSSWTNCDVDNRKFRDYTWLDYLYLENCN